MTTGANVFGIESLSNAMHELTQCKELTMSSCDEGINQAQITLEETQQEEQTSKGLLEVAKGVEMATHARLVALEAELAMAIAELAASTPHNPAGMAAAGAKIAEVEPQIPPARQEYEEAVRHRENLERRYDMAVKCVNLAQERLEALQTKFEYGRRSVENIVSKTVARLDFAYQDLTKYSSRIPPAVKDEIGEWFEKKPRNNEPIRPDEIKERLNVSDPVVDSVLEYLYATDVGFRANVDSYCNEMRHGNETGVELKIKKNMVGRLCEELVIRSFKPYCKEIITQGREPLPDGSYTKVDMIAKGLTNPVILGRGEGMGAREGGSVAIEVKSGHKEYLYSQLKHLQSQAIGHSGCDTSCVICSRDIHDLSPEKENELREKLRIAGSPMIGMLPRKDDLDSRCISFVKGKMQDV